MKKILFSFIVVILFSCNSTMILEGKKFELSDNEELINIHFLSSDVCEIQQYFYCENIPDSLKNKIIRAKYEVHSSKLPYTDGNKNKFLKVNLIMLSNLDTLSKRLPKYTYINNYSKLCQDSLVENSNEMKLRNKLPSGIVLNLVNDSLIFKKDTIIFGYKKVPIMGNGSK